MITLTFLNQTNEQVFQDFKFKGRSIEWEDKVGIIEFSGNRKIVIKPQRRTPPRGSIHGYRFQIKIQDKIVNRRTFSFKDFFNLDDAYIISEMNTPVWYGGKIIKRDDGSFREMNTQELDLETVSKGLERLRSSIFDYLSQLSEWE